MDARRAGPAGVALLALATLLPGWGRRDLWDPDEARYAWIARDMQRRGAWLSPELNGVPYTSKPPPFFWLVAAASTITGRVDTAAPLVSIVAGALTCACTFAIGRRLVGTRAALLGVGALLVTVQVHWTLRRAMLDPTLTLASTASVLALLRAEDGARAGAWRFAAGLAAGLGFVVKGPAALLGPLIVAGARRWSGGPRWRASHLALAALAAALPALALGACYLLAGSLGRGLEVGAPALRHPAGLVDKVGLPTYYLTALPPDALPWTFLLPAAALAAWRPSRDHGGRRCLLAWLAAGLFVLSCVPAKRSVYLLPLYPALALLVGVVLAAPRGRLAIGGLAAVLAVELLAAPAALGLGLVLAWWRFEPGTLQAAWQTAALARVGPLEVAFTLGVASAVAWIAASGLAALREPAGRADLRVARRAARQAVVAGLLGTVWFGAVALPLEDVRRSTRPLARWVVEALARGERVAFFGGRTWRPSLNLNGDVRELSFVSDAAGISSLVERGGGVVVVRHAELDAVQAAAAPRATREVTRFAHDDEWTLVVRVDGMERRP